MASEAMDALACTVAAWYNSVRFTHPFVYILFLVLPANSVEQQSRIKIYEEWASEPMESQHV